MVSTQFRYRIRTGGIHIHIPTTHTHCNTAELRLQLQWCSVLMYTIHIHISLAELLRARPSRQLPKQYDIYYKHDTLLVYMIIAFNTYKYIHIHRSFVLLLNVTFAWYCLALSLSTVSNSIATVATEH